MRLFCCDVLHSSIKETEVDQGKSLRNRFFVMGLRSKLRRRSCETFVQAEGVLRHFPWVVLMACFVITVSSHVKNGDGAARGVPVFSLFASS